MKEIIANRNNTYTVITNDGWSVTANALLLEEVFSKCLNVSLTPYLKKTSSWVSFKKF